MAYSIKDSFLLSAALTAHSMQVASSFFTKERIVSCLYPPTTPTVTRCIPLSVGSEPWQVHVRRIVIRTPHPAVFFTSFCIPTPENVSPFSWLEFGYVRGIETVYLYTVFVSPTSHLQASTPPRPVAGFMQSRIYRVGDSGECVVTVCNKNVVRSEEQATNKSTYPPDFNY